MLDDGFIFNVLIAPVWHFLNPGDRLSLIYQFTALLVAIFVYIMHHAKDGRLQVAGLPRMSCCPNELVMVVRHAHRDGVGVVLVARHPNLIRHAVL